MFNITWDGKIAVLTWDTPNSPVNVLNEESLTAMHKALESIWATENCLGIIFASAKKDYIAGADLKKLTACQTHADVEAFIAPFHQLMRKIETSGIPVVAAISGNALGGGCEVALSCHARFMANDASIKIGLPEVKWGLLPGGGGTQRLPRLLGIEKALKLMLEGTLLTPQDAFQAGIIDQVVAKESLLAACKAYLLGVPRRTQPWDDKNFIIPGGGPFDGNNPEIFTFTNAAIRKKTHGLYKAPPAIVACVYEGAGVPFDKGLAIEQAYFADLVVGVQSKHIIRTQFTGKNQADKLIRRPKEFAPFTFKKIGILGAGMMGGGIAFAAARAGLQVILLDSEQAFAEKGKTYSEKVLAKQGLPSANIQAHLEHITATTDYSQLKGCDLVVEAVFENRDLKHTILQKAEVHLAQDAVLASNTSTLSISDLATACTRPTQVIGLHFFSPVDKMALVEVIKGTKTSQACLAKALDFVKLLRKTPIVVNDGHAFYTTRVFMTYLDEAMRMLAEGVTPALIENAGKMAGMPIGPLALSDELSLSLMIHIKSEARRVLGDAYVADTSDDVCQLFVHDLKRAGRKSKAGFYEYFDDGNKQLWPMLSTHFTPAKTQPEVDALIDRFLVIQALEAIKCLQEGIVEHAFEADLGSVLGWGFAPQTGGVLSYIEGIGLSSFTQLCEQLTTQYGKRFTPPELLLKMRDSGQRFYM